MKALYTISLFLFIKCGFAQKYKLEGIWVEYKKETIGDTSLNYVKELQKLKLPLATYEFFSDSHFVCSDKLNYIIDYKLNGDTITYINEIESEYKGDVNLRSLYYLRHFHFKAIDTLILEDFVQSKDFGYRSYLKKVTKWPKPTFNEKMLFGKWLVYKQEIVGDANTEDYLFNNNFANNITYQFFEDNSFTMCGETSNCCKHFHEFELNSDVLTLLIAHGDQHSYPGPHFTVSMPKQNEMIFTDAVDTAYFAKRIYLKRIQTYSGKTNSNLRPIDKEAEFLGGLDSLSSFFLTNDKNKLIYPKDNKHFSVVHLTLTIDEFGKVIDAEVKDYPKRKLAKEAIRIAKLLPNWIPAKSLQLDSPHIDAPEINVKSMVDVYVPIRKQ